MWLVAIWLCLYSAFAGATEPAGVLKVKATVEAEVFLDGVPLGSTPVTKYVEVGPHRVRVVADHFDPFVRQINIEAAKTTELNATLIAGNGTVEFSGPRGATLTVGTEAYSLPIRIASPGAGTLRWTAVARGFEDTEGSLAIVAGRNHLVEIAMQSTVNVIAVTSKPEGATVRLDGTEVGRTPLRLTGIASGPHGVEVRAEGYATAFRRADNLDGAKVSVEVSLGKAGAELSFTGLAEDAVVRLDGVEVGRGRSVSVGLVERGRVEAEVVEGEHVATGKLDIPVSGSVAATVRGEAVVEVEPLTRSWRFWAAVGGGVAIAGGTTAAVIVATQPAPPPEGDVTVTLP